MLRFHNGKFKIMQIADIQDTQITSPDTLRFIKRAIEKERPDLIVFSGDQVKSYGINIKRGNPVLNMQQTVCNILTSLSETNTPFTYVFGNHDAPDNESKQAQIDIYEAYDNCVNRFAVNRLKQSEGICLTVQNGEDNVPALLLYLMDTHGNNAGVYDGVTDEQIEWIKATNQSIKDEYSTVPALLFQHIPVYEMYDILEEVPKGQISGIEGNNSHREHFYTVTEEMRRRGEYMGENIACPKNKNGEFDALVSMGNVMGAFFGHDHNNCFTGNLKGIELGYTPGAGFHVYGPGFQRGVRIIECNEGENSFTTRMVTYSDLFGTKVKEKAKCKFYNHAPSSVDAVMPTVKKIGAVSLGVGVITAFIKLKK